ncbi:MAG: TIGR03016 family PEP-CTERM system-associated outer membrane protein [Rubrivivax sp.]|nr:TIGR03016 family PEP-CTERM system-associated outer membrane protein [Rubrivivax sp.]
MQRGALVRVAAATSLCAPLLASAQSSGGLSVVPSLSISQSVTDNINLSQDKRAEAITSVSPGVRVSSRSGRLQGTLDYSLNANYYARDGERSGFTNALAAGFTSELVPNIASIDAKASVSQQAISAFGVQGVDPNLGRSNRTEVRVLSLTPVVRGRLTDTITAQASSTWTRSTSSGAVGAESTALAHAAQIGGQAGRFGWSADVADVTSSYGAGGRKTGNRRFGLGLSYTPNSDLQVNVHAGRETETVRDVESQSTNNYGFGATWSPSPRTTATARYDRRYFGNGYALQLSHRMVRGLITLSDSRDANNGAVSDRTLAFVQRYDEVFRQLVAAGLPANVADQLTRLVLQNENLFIGRAVALQRRQDVALVLQGVRSTVALTVFRSSSIRLDQASTATDDLSLADGLSQRGYSLTGSYTVSSTTSLALAYSDSRNGGERATVPGVRNDLRSFTASLTGRLTQRVNYSLSARHTTFDSALSPYTENGAQLTLSFAF